MSCVLKPQSVVSTQSVHKHYNRQHLLIHLQRVLNAAARVASNCGKYDRGPTHFLRHVLHWLDVTDRIRFQLCVQVYKCQHSVAAGYLVDLCRPVSSIDGLRHLRSAYRGQLQVPRIRRSTYESRALGHAGPSTSNALPNILKCSTRSLPTFRRAISDSCASRSTSAPSAFDVTTLYYLRTQRYLLTLLHALLMRRVRFPSVWTILIEPEFRRPQKIADCLQDSFAETMPCFIEQPPLFIIIFIAWMIWTTVRQKTIQH